MILEDDAYGELRFEGEAHPSLYALDNGGRVIRAGTLSKILGAGVRLGWLCAPRPLIPALQGFLYGGGVSPYMSRVATYYMREHMAPHVATLVDVYRDKRDAMLRALWEVLEGTDVEISRPEGGFFIWIKLPTGTDPARLRELAVQAAHPVQPGPGLLRQRRRRRVHPPRLQLRAAGALLRGSPPHRPGHPGGARVALGPHRGWP